ncbi:PH domain-containing protein [Candidatus Nitrosacidococcus sp. I8]|uniref:PH domain-containing protein n=1 Tax=Candidatus Nitrosacidococcus sp. I8 TaxID=2942908 RepID=UPI00222786B2|nr:PH domain-containing protein [Candidatus Nitrosacidococcus sp. I8]CAH9016737.1 hypothetical protein NURINAE_00241 [Candidatus Nitrosacidococcus sp. I8]
MNEETKVWSGSQSQIVNFGTYIICSLIPPIAVGVVFYLKLTSSVPAISAAAGIGAIAILYSFWCFLETKSQYYELTSQRLKSHNGVFSRKIEELELYRVRDTELYQSFFERIFGLGTITIISTDATTPTSLIEGIKGAEALREQIRHYVEECRTNKEVKMREME